MANYQLPYTGEEIEEKLSKIDLLENHINYFLSEYDPQYTPPKTFSDYPAGTILQGYAEYDRRYNKSFSATLTTGRMVFSAENQSEGTIKFKVNFTANRIFSGLVTIYQNGTSIFTETVSFDDSSLVFEYQKQLAGITLADGNYFYITIGTNPTSTSLVLTHLNAQLVAPNAEVINQISPYSVEYFNGKYYISDCSGSTAKTAEINVEDMYNMNSLTWTDMGISALIYKTSFFVGQYGSVYQPTEKVYAYQTLDDKITFVSEDGTKTKTVADFNLIAWLQTTDTSNSYFGIRTTNYVPVSQTLTTVESAMYLSNNNYLSGSSTRKYVTQTKSNGDFYACLKHANNVNPAKIAKGINCHTYYNTISNSVSTFKTYFKHYDKILCANWQYSSSTGIQLNSTEEIGAYEEYWPGVNNDYFVVKNGELKYHKILENNGGNNG